MPTFTTNYGLSKPLVNNATDQDLWGGELNGDMDELDVLLKVGMNFTPSSSQTSTFSVTAPTVGSQTTGSANMLYLCDATGGAFAANLPTAASCSGMKVAFKKTDATTNAVTITGNGSETIDGSNTLALAGQYNAAVIVSNGTSWSIISVIKQTVFKAPNLIIATTSGTYTPSAGIIGALVRMVGAGGASGDNSGGGSGGGGGAGTYAEAVFTAATIGGSQTITINSSTTSFGALLIAPAGSAGSNSGVPGNGGGAATGATFSILGQPGGHGGTAYAYGGAGGSTVFGYGGQAVATASTAGNPGVGYGSGASGGSGAVGAAAGPGVVYILEYFN